MRMMVMMQNNKRCFLVSNMVLVLTTLLLVRPSTSSSSLPHVLQQQQQQENNRRTLQSSASFLDANSATKTLVSNEGGGAGAALAVYKMPPFAVQLEAPASLFSDRLTRTLVSPLRITTAEFLLESFRLDILKDLNTDNPQLPPMMRQLITLTFGIQLQHNWNNATSTTSTAADWVTVYAVFDGSVSFQEPYNPSLKVSNSQVYEIMGAWIRQTFRDDFDLYQSYLKQESDEPILQDLRNLYIQTDLLVTESNGNNNPFLGKQKQQNTNDNALQPASRPTTKSIVLLFLSLLAMAGVASIITLLFPVVRARRRFRLHQMHGRPPADSSHNNHSSVLPGRGREEDYDTDPNTTTTVGQDLTSDHFQVISNNNDGTVQIIAEQQNMQLPGNCTTQFRNAGVAAVTNTTGDEEEEDVLDPAEYDDYNNYDLEAYYSDDDAYGNSGNSWWTRLTRRLQISQQQQQHDYPDQQQYPQEPLECDQDASAYDFPYRDFPRKDGTPCLIYNQTADGIATENVIEFRASTSFTSCHSNDDKGDSSDDDCPYRAAIRGAYDHGGNLQLPSPLRQYLPSADFLNELVLSDDITADFEIGTLQDDYHYDNDEDDEDDEDEILSTSMNNRKNMFIDKLERLLAMRRRHLEKTMIIEKGRRARTAARQQQQQRTATTATTAGGAQQQQEATVVRQRQQHAEEEARQRELKLRRHEMELDLVEIEASMTPLRALSSYQQQQQQQLLLPIENRQHRQNLSDPDVHVAAAMAAAATTNIHTSSTTSKALSSIPQRTGSARRHHLPPPPPMTPSLSRPPRHQNDSENNNNNNIANLVVDEVFRTPQQLRAGNEPTPINIQRALSSSSLKKLAQNYGNGNDNDSSTMMTISDSASVSSTSSSRGSAASNSSRRRSRHHHHHHRNRSASPFQRRMSSHGTEEKKTDVAAATTTANLTILSNSAPPPSSSDFDKNHHDACGDTGAEDVMTFGIAAYTHLV